MTDRFNIIPVKDHEPDHPEAIVTGPLSEMMACISVAALNEKLVALGEELAARARELDEREAQLNELATSIVDTGSRVADTGSRVADSFEKARALSVKREAAERERRDRQRVAAMLDALPDPDAPATLGDDGDLEIKHKPDPEKYGAGNEAEPNEQTDDEEEKPPKAALSYGPVKKPPLLSYVKSERMSQEGHDAESGDPMPFNPNAPGETEKPEPGPDPGTILYPRRPGIPQPTSTSLW
jgi:hypothetical protein